MQSAIDITAHYRLLNSLVYCICTTSMTNLRSEKDNPVSLSLEPQPDRIGHRDDLLISNTKQNTKLVRVPINVASNIYKHDK